MVSANIPNNVRKAIYRRDGYACALCGDPRHLNIHHVLPRGRFGGNSPYNLIALCRVCHAAAHGTMLVDDFPLTPENVEQACVEYVADMYAGEHRPALELDYSSPEDVKRALELIHKGIMYNSRGY